MNAPGPWRVLWAPRAYDDLRRFHPATVARLRAAVRAYAEAGVRPDQLRPIPGSANRAALATFGDLRVWFIYRVAQRELVVWMARAAPPEDV